MEKSTALTLEQSSSFNAEHRKYFSFLLSDGGCEYSEYLAHKTSVAYVKNVVKIVVYYTKLPAAQAVFVCGVKANSMQKKKKKKKASKAVFVRSQCPASTHVSRVERVEVFCTRGGYVNVPS